MKHELAIRNLVAKVFFDTEGYGKVSWEACDIPTRDSIDEFIKKLKRLLEK